MVKKHLWWSPEELPVDWWGDEAGWKVVTTTNLAEILQSPAFQQVRDDTAEKRNREETLLAILKAVDLEVDASSRPVSDEATDTPPSWTE